MKHCNDCAHWGENLCVDNEGKPINRETATGLRPWTYETCAKNWGLPKNAFTSAHNCTFFKQKDKK